MNWKSVMKVAKRLWISFANAVGASLDEALYRIVLAFRVLFGLVPIEIEKRRWTKSIETPALLDVADWTNGRLIYGARFEAGLRGRS